LIASLDILSNNFLEDDPISKDLRTMSYAISKMADEELNQRLVGEICDFDMLDKIASNPWMDHMKKVRKENPGKSLKELIGIAKKTYKKADQEQSKESSEEVISEEVEISDSWTKEASYAVAKALVADVISEKAAGKVRGIPDGTGPYGRGMGPGKGRADGTGLKENEKDDEKTAGKIKGPGKPDGTGPMSDTPACPFNKEKSDKEAGQNDPNYFSKKPAAPKDEKVSEEEAPKEEAPKEEAPKEEAPKEEAPKEEAPKEEAPKEEASASKKEEIVNTNMLASEDQDFEPVQEMLASEDIGELTAEEKAQLDSLFI
jgi:hypothetical protein